jgi:aspartyl-tRNA(Asn)/glutamyl-tRNA(Gln) amidotransferase subunit A
MAALVEGLPIGLQIVGPMFAEQNILRASCCVEQACATGARPSVGAGGLPHKEKQ